ncbi:2815_t:CDS:1, partial [Paraglomus occultum]
MSSDTVMEAAKKRHSLSAFEERNSIQALIDKLPFTDPINAEEYLRLEEEAVLSNSITDEDIVRIILGNRQDRIKEEEKEAKKRVSIEKACRGAE